MLFESDDELELELLFEFELLFDEEFELEFDDEFEFEFDEELELELLFELELEFEFELPSGLPPSCPWKIFLRKRSKSSSAEAGGAANEVAMKATVATLARFFIGGVLPCEKQPSVTAQG